MNPLDSTATDGSAQMCEPATCVIDSAQSLCPRCLRTIPARAVREGAAIFLEKHCEEHGPFRVLVESNADFYGEARELAARPLTFAEPRHLVVITTRRCNLKCPLCYVPYQGAAEELSVRDVAELLDRVACQRVLFAGGEPTVMDSLPDFLRLVRRRGRLPMIVTNGLKLADAAYLRDLARSGLGAAVVSLNGLTPGTLARIDGRDILDEKLRAIENLKSCGIRYSVSFSLVRGVNEAEMTEAIDLAARDYPRSIGFLMENLPSVGRHTGAPPVPLSEILTLFAAGTGVSLGKLTGLARAGRAELNPYFYATDLSLVLSLGRQSRRMPPGFLVRFLSSPNADTVDLGQTRPLDRVLCASSRSPVMPLWEYLARGRT